MPFRAVTSSEIFASPAPMSPATLTNGSRMLHISGQVPQDASGTNVAKGDVVAQTHKVIDNIEALLSAEGGTLADVCKVTVFLTSRDHLPAVMDVRKKRFGEPFPAATAIIVAGLANADWLVEIEAVAVLA